MAKVQRRVDYYKITAQDGDNGLFGEKLKEICENLTPQQREMGVHSTSLNIEIIDSDSGDNLIRGSIKQIRSVAPSKRKKGKIETRPVELEADEGIDEKTHFIYCPDTSYICIEYNYHGPKITLLLEVINKLYKQEIDPDAKRSGYTWMQNGNALEKVLEKRQIRAVQAKLIDPSTVEGLGEPDLPGVYEQFKAPRNATIEFAIKSKARGAFAMQIQDFKRLFIGNRFDLQNYERLKVTVVDEETGKDKLYDLVKDKLQDEFSVDLREGTSEIDTENIIGIMERLLDNIKENYVVG
ncbi:MAG: hypothetical protein JWO41_520 [Candidatus Saccharibacteria bacterium]|nr:hypothetical protein [Candidatus Saccharibacteria bacterium]